MTDTTTPDPNEMLQLPPMKRADFGNLILCVDAMRKACPIEQVPTVMALIEALASATPAAKVEPRRQHDRRGKVRTT